MKNKIIALGVSASMILSAFPYNALADSTGNLDIGNNVENNIETQDMSAELADERVYYPIEGGFETLNGTKSYTRPIYAPHINDGLDSSGLNAQRFIYYLGDKPKLALTDVIDKNDYHVRKYANMFFGIKTDNGGKWFEKMDSRISRYVYGHEEYELKDSSFEGTIKMTFTRSDKLDAMLIKVELPEGLEDKFVTATVPQGGSQGDEPQGGSYSKLEFKPESSSSAEITLDETKYSITNNRHDVNGTANISMDYSLKDASVYNKGVNRLISSEYTDKPMIVGTSEGNTQSVIYLMLTTEDSDNEYYLNYADNAEELFNEGLEYYKSMSEVTKIDSPNPYLNSAFTSQTMALDASWNDPVICHAPIAFHHSYAGWRTMYSYVTADWKERVKANIREYIRRQSSKGRIPAFADGKDSRYNMGVVLVDELLYYWLWTGDDEFFEDEAYDFAAKYLDYQDTYLGVEGTSLYENFLDAWNTDNKWNNGGAGTVASSYTWRAYSVMAQIAERLGKTEDAQKYEEKANKIKSDMKEQLWDNDKGVYGEYRDFFGEKRLHNSPDLSSVYTPIDVGITDFEEAYQMLHFTDYAIESTNVDGYEFKCSSEWKPLFYSSSGYYQQEVLNNSLANFQTGQGEKGFSQLMSCVIPMFRLNGGPGETAHTSDSSGNNTGHIDFADTTAMFTRTVITGLYGVNMNKAYNKAVISPCFPSEWNYASFSANYLKYNYTYDGSADTFDVTTDDELDYEMNIPARTSDVESVKVNGQNIEFTLDSSVHFTVPKTNSAVVEIKYGNGEKAEISSKETGAAGYEYSITSNGVITEISDPQSVIKSNSELNNEKLTVLLNDKLGNHTFFVTVKKDDSIVKLPVDLEIREPIEITDMASEGNKSICFNLRNNTENKMKINAEFNSLNDSIEKELEIEPGEKTETISIGAKLTPGENKILANISGDFTGKITGKYEDWTINSEDTIYKTISISDEVNQNLRTLHENTYDITYNGDEHYRLPDFYWVTASKTGTTRTVLPNGRSWWEPSNPSHKGAGGVPKSLSLPENGGIYCSGIGVPFDIACGNNGENAAFVSLYNQFPEKINIPIKETASKLYFMLSVSTNSMQNRIENARITVNYTDGTSEKLSLTNPDNIDDWLSYQLTPYAESGYIEMLESKAHSNILSIDFGEAKDVESIDLECLSNEVLAGLLGITAVTAEKPDKSLTVSSMKFSSDRIESGIPVTVSAEISNTTDIAENVALYAAVFDENGRLKYIKHMGDEVASKSKSTISTEIEGENISQSDYINAFIWNGNKEPISETIKLGNTI